MKYLVALLFIISSLASAQQGTTQVNAETGNIVYTTLNPPPPGAPFTWNGFVNLNTGGGGLQGGNVPAYNSQTGTFIWGYMPGTVAYTTAVNFALASAGTGIQVNGFKYSWEYFNQDFSRGPLSGNISLTSNTGKLLENYNYFMPLTTEGWTTMSGIQNFNTQYAPPSLGNLQVSFSGKDDRFWAGYYGPQIRAIDVRLLYSSASITSSNTTTTPTSTDTNTSSTINTIIAAAAEPITTTTTNSTPTTNTETTVVASTSTSQPASNTSTPNNTTVAVIKDETTVTKESSVEKSNTSGPSLSSILANIKSNQDKQQNIAMAAVASSIEVANNVVQKAEQTALSAANASAQQALQTAQDSSNVVSTKSNSIMMNIESNKQTQSTTVTALNTVTGTSNNPVFDLFARPESKNITVTTMAAIDYSLRPQSSNTITTYTPPTVTTLRPESKPVETIIENQFTIQEIRPILRQPTIDMFANTNTSNAINTTIAFGKKGDPIQDYIEANNAAFNEMKAESKSTTVRTNTQDNDIAGGVRIERMAVIPAGFNAYTNLSLSNIAFYEPKEIYKNQKVIDNARALRQLSSDRLHQEMVEQQYRR